MKSHPEKPTQDDTTQPELLLDPEPFATGTMVSLRSNLYIETPSGSVAGSSLPHRFMFYPVSVERCDQACSMHYELRVNVASGGGKPDERILSVNITVVNKEKLT